MNISILRVVFNLALLLGISQVSFLCARQTQDMYVVIDCPPMQLLYLQPCNLSIKASEDSQAEPATPFALYSFSTNQANQIFSVALSAPAPKDIKLFIKAEAPEGARSFDWVELSFEMKPLVSEIQPGFGKDLRLYLKAQATPETEAFDVTQLQLRYRFDRS